MPEWDIRTFIPLFEDSRVDQDLTVLTRWVVGDRLWIGVGRIEPLDSDAELIAVASGRGNRSCVSPDGGRGAGKQGTNRPPHGVARTGNIVHIDPQE
ncbi:hypothetical protein CFP75_20750 [Amycolatopsis alba DSM 44262]|uniref:Uncharacterized protein n=1 Tax=Amycolatopsis alba DSM 44262 TaxID=1125972 RepID=A0A229RQE3_AMYAL|nr:hypothetical protein CFP75_20750 [Amycolatopsis alba DSM 44262]